jgi:hypothetical protein
MAPGDRFEGVALLARARGRDFLFSERAQSVFELNSSAALAWRELAEGRTVGETADRLAAIGMSETEAQEAVRALIVTWRELGLVRPASRVPCPEADPGRAQTIAIAGLRARIIYPAHLEPDTASVFRHLEIPAVDADLCFEVVAQAGSLDIFENGNWTMASRAEELPVTLKGLLLQRLLERADYCVALHAAMVLTDDGAILLLGPPGRGKTTLALSLVHSGYRFGGDDVTLIRTDSRCAPIPFASAVKSGARRLLAGRYPGLGALPEFIRPDGRRVRYLPPTTEVDPAGVPIHAVLVLDRSRSGGAGVTPLDPAAALASLINGAYAPEERLSEEAFHVLVGLIEARPIYRLSYSRAEDAVAVIQTTCA